MNNKSYQSYLFVNPASGHYSARNWQLVLESLHKSGITPEVFQARTPTEISAYCTTINENTDHHLVIVAGGDGTFNAVVNGLNPGTATLAVLPFGTSNVLAAEIGIKSLDDAIARIACGKTDSLSVGVIKLKERSLRFVLMAGIGLDGAVVRDVQPRWKKYLRQGAYALSALKNATAWDPAVFEMSVPEGDVTCHTAIICNASRYGGDFILSPDSSPFSSGFSAVCITGNKRRTYLSSVLDLFLGKAESNKTLLRLHSASFEIRGRRPIQIDGDFVGYGPAQISELADFARMIV